MKKILLVVFILILGVFIYLKVQVLGDPNSSFNRTTRFTLAKHPFMRTILGMHSAGDARAEYFLGSGPIIIEWFKPQTENDEVINQDLLDKFAQEVEKYTGRRTKILYGGAISDNSVPLLNLAAYELKSNVQKSAGTTLLLFFTQDYSPKPQAELASTYAESGIVVSLDAHRNTFSARSWQLGDYFVSSMLHEFGHQIGLEHNTGRGCVMNAEVETGGDTVFISPKDFCDEEQSQIAAMKAKLSN